MPHEMHVDTLDNLPYQLLKSTELLQVLCHIYQLRLDHLEGLRWYFWAGKKKTNTLLDSGSTKPSCIINVLDKNSAKMLLNTFEGILSPTEQAQVSENKYNNAYNFSLKF